MHHHHVTQITGFAAFFALGLTTSIHCIGMCAPITTIFFQNVKRSRMFFYYHFARTASYAFLGLVLGYIGKSISFIIPFPYIFSLICIIFLTYIFEIRLPIPKWFMSTQAMILKLLPKSGIQRLLVFGFLTPLLPCAPLYMGLSASVAAPTPFLAMGWMFAFGMGTIPLLFLAQSGISALSKTAFQRYQKIFFKIMATITLGFVAWMVFFMHHG